MAINMAAKAIFLTIYDILVIFRSKLIDNLLIHYSKKKTTKTHSLSINLLLKIEITDFSIVGQFFRFFFSMYNFAQSDTFVLPVNENGPRPFF
jgi:hypothetical protein